MKLTPVKNFVITPADRAVCLGSGEIKDCPFCGTSAHSAGRKNEESGNTVYTVMCGDTLGCGAHINVCQKDPEHARREAIQQWNTRVVSNDLKTQMLRVCKEAFGYSDTIGGEPFDDYVIRQVAKLRAENADRRK